MCDTDCLASIRYISSIAVPAIAGLVGVVLGGWLATWRDRQQRRLDFVEKQLFGFYSPMLGLRNDVRRTADGLKDFLSTANGRRVESPASPLGF